MVLRGLSKPYLKKDLQIYKERFLRNHYCVNFEQAKILSQEFPHDHKSIRMVHKVQQNYIIQMFDCSKTREVGVIHKRSL